MYVEAKGQPCLASLGPVHIWGLFVFETESLSGLDLANEVRLAGR